jgi:hypothetical protein
LFRVAKRRSEKRRHAVSRLFSHSLGWEVRLEINGDLKRSQGCGAQDEVLNVADEWKAAIIEKEWV